MAVHIPAGAPENYEEVFHGEADESVDWEAGDVIVRVKSRRKDGQGSWGRKDGGIIGRITLSVAEVSTFLRRLGVPKLTDSLSGLDWV